MLKRWVGRRLWFLAAFLGRTGSEWAGKEWADEQVQKRLEQIEAELMAKRLPVPRSYAELYNRFPPVEHEMGGEGG